MGDTGDEQGYGLITAVTIGAENASISYTSVTEEVVLKAMEMFVEEAPSEEQIEAAVDEQAIRESITAQIMESGFVAETGAYLAEKYSNMPEEAWV